MSKDSANLSNIFDRLSASKKIQEHKSSTIKQPLKEEKEENSANKKTTSKKPLKETTTIEKESDMSTTQLESISRPKTVTKESQEEPTVPKEVVEHTPKNVPQPSDPFSSSILNKFEEKSKKRTIEETHTRNTIFIRNDLHYRLQELTSHKRGLKTMLINEAVEAILDILDNKK